MMNEEVLIESKMGKRNPFTVPSGYFDQLTEQIMQNIPEESMQTAQIHEIKPAKRAILRSLRPLFYAAACTCIAVFGVATYQHLNKQTTETPQLQSNIVTVHSYSDSYIDEATDYAMLDNDDIYASLLADM
jgi:uncharacterized protein YqkB